MDKYKLRKIREASDISLRKIAERIKMSPSVLSKVERGEWPASPLAAVAIADGYGLSRQQVLADFLINTAQSAKEEDVWRAFLKSVGEFDRGKACPLTEHSDSAIIAEALARLRRMSRALRAPTHALRLLDDAASVRTHATALVKDGKAVRYRIYSTSLPVPLVLEYHWFPPGRALYRRLPAERSLPSPTGFFSICAGTGWLLVHGKQGWQEQALRPSGAGVYLGTYDHVWMNTGKEELVVCAGCFAFYPPHQPRSRLGQDLRCASVHCEFAFADLSELPRNVRDHVEEVLKKLPAHRRGIGRRNAQHGST